MRTDPDYLYKIALMYYKEKLTQQQISEKISISRPMVSRALALAEQCGIVEIKVHSPGIIDSLTEELRQLIGVDSVYVAPAVTRTGNDRDDRTADIAAYAPHILADLMETSGKMGIGWGETVYRTVIKMNVMDLPKSDNRYIVPLVNSLGCREPHYQVNVLTSMLSAAVGGTPMFLNTSQIARDSEIYRMWENLDTALFGLGSFSGAQNFPEGFLQSDTKKELVGRNAIGDVLGRFFTTGGFVDSWNGDYTGIPEAILEKVPSRICLSGGRDKTQAIITAARLGLFNKLITDIKTAEELVKALKEEPV